MSAKFDLRQLRYFVVVAEELNFRRAAERLFISQPPLSRQIRELETILDVQLLERDTTRVVLTPAGKLAFHRARKLLAEADELVAAMKSAADQQASRIRIAASIAIPVSKQAELLAAWRKALGTDAIEVEFGESKKLQPRVRQHQFDLALLGGPGDFRGLESVEVQHFPLVAVFAAGHPAARKRTVALRDLQGTPLFWFPRTYNPAYFAHCARVFEQCDFVPRFIFVAPGQLATLERIKHGEGFSLLTTAQVEMKVDGVVHRPLKEGRLLGVSQQAVWQASGDPVRQRQAQRFVAASRKVLAAKQQADAVAFAPRPRKERS